MKTVMKLREFSNRFKDKSLDGAIMQLEGMERSMALIKYCGGLAWFVDITTYPGGVIKMVPVDPEDLLNTPVERWAGIKIPLMEGDFVYVGEKREKVTRVKESDGSPFPIVTEGGQYSWEEVRMIVKS